MSSSIFLSLQILVRWALVLTFFFGIVCQIIFCQYLNRRYYKHTFFQGLFIFISHVVLNKKVRFFFYKKYISVLDYKIFIRVIIFFNWHVYMLRNCFDEVMQALRHDYPAFSAFKSITEESKKETTTVATSQLTSNLGSKSLKVKVKKKTT